MTRIYVESSVKPDNGHWMRLTYDSAHPSQCEHPLITSTGHCGCCGASPTAVSAYYCLRQLSK